MPLECKCLISVDNPTHIIYAYYLFHGKQNVNPSHVP